MSGWTTPKLQFAIVREDPRIEVSLLAGRPPGRALLIASGGCTAITLATKYPGWGIDVVDTNAAQLALLRRKQEALRRPRAERLRAFGVDNPDPSTLTQGGQFESLFRVFRRFLEEFVAPAAEIQAAFETPDAVVAFRAVLAQRPYWPVAFDLHFSDSLLETMFGPDATQHAPKGSYPRYFQRVFERELERPRAATNPFLHHIMLGHFRADPESLPDYLAEEPPPALDEIREIHGPIAGVPDFATYDLVSLSNIFDWMDAGAAHAIAARIGDEMRPGARVILRQLNNATDYTEVFGDRFAFDAALGRDLHERDRSMFYERITVGVRR